MRKTLSIVLSLLMVLSIFAPVFAEEEVTAENIAKDEEFIEFLKEQNIIEGDKSGDLMLDKDIDRASFAAILVRADGKDAVAKSVATLPSKFADMTAAHWANGYATVAHDNLWMKGNPANEFMPGRSISYAEIATTLVRYLGEEKDGMVYPTSYIAKATELGLFKGTEEIAGEYTKNAVRRNVFMMLYNALSREDFGKYNVYKMIVLENNRVAQLGKNQIKAEVLSVVQMANNVNERGVAKVGEQMVFDIENVKVENGLADTENLMGKVANFTVDQNGKLVKVVVDNTNYEYYWGGFSADAKTFEIAGKKFNVRFDERYYTEDYRYRGTERDDRVYRTYVTNDRRAENYNYIDFAERLNLKKGDDRKLNANFARITVRDGMVLFVDAYNYTDIAPVQKVERDGNDVYYWNDARDAAVERMTPAPRIIGYTAKDGFRLISKSDIKADDTIHWMDGLTLVRQDAKLDANLVKTYIDKWGEFAVLKAGEAEDAYYLNSKKFSDIPFQSVYAYDDMHFRRLDSRAQIDDMVKSDVKVLLDVFGDIQLITSHEKFTDRLALVDKVISAKGMEFYLPNAPEEVKFRLTDSWDSNYYRYGWNATQTWRFDRFNRLDLVYTAADKDGNAKTVAMIDGFAYGYDKDTEDYNFDRHKWAYAAFIDARRDFVRVGSKDYRYTDETDVFVINVDPRTGKRDYVISKVTLADVKKYNAGNTDLMAAVLTEKEYADFLDKIDVATWGRYNDARDDFAKAIIFTNYKGPQADLEKPEIGRIARIDNYSNVVEIEVSRGMFEEFKIAPGSAVNMRNRGLIGEYVEFRRVKDSDPKAARFDAIITATAEGKVEDRRAYSIKLEGHSAFKTDVNTKEFGDSRLDYAWVYVRGGYADLIVYTKPGAVPAPELVPSDYVDYNLFKAALAAAQTAKPTDADYATKVKAALDAYEGLTDAAKKLLVTEDEKKALDALEDTVPAVKFQADYDKALRALYDFNKKIKAKAEKNITTDEEYKEAKGLLEVYDAYAKVTGIDKTKGINGNDDSDIRATTKNLMDVYNNSIEADKTAAAQKRVNAYRDSEARRIANEFARVMNNYTDEVNAKVVTEIKAVNDAITALEEKKFTVADASDETHQKSLVDVEISKIKTLITEYVAAADAAK